MPATTKKTRGRPPKDKKAALKDQSRSETPEVGDGPVDEESDELNQPRKLTFRLFFTTRSDTFFQSTKRR